MATFFRAFFFTLFLIAVVVVVPIVYLGAAIGATDLPWLTGIDSADLQNISPDHSGRDSLRQRIDQQLQSASSFDITLTEHEVNRIFEGELAGLGRLHNPRFDLKSQGGRLSAELAGRVPVPLEADVTFSLDGGRIRLHLHEVSIGFLTFPEPLLDPAGTLLNYVAGVNQVLSRQGDVRLAELRSGNAALRMTGYRVEGTTQISDTELATALSDPFRNIPAPRERAYRAPSTVPSPGEWKYLALGDSLAAGEGASSPANNYATRFRQYLEATFNVDFAFTNLGIPGESTSSFVQGPESQLDRAIAEIKSLQNDGDPATQTHVITLSLGVNDIIPTLEGPVCRAGPGDPGCRTELDNATSLIETNMNVILRRLREAAGPETLIMLMTYYDPFDFGSGLAFEALSDETMRNLNGRIVAAAQANDIAIADAHPLFRGLAARLTHVLEGDVHPVDRGYGVLLLAFQDAYERIGPFR